MTPKAEPRYGSAFGVIELFDSSGVLSKKLSLVINTCDNMITLANSVCDREKGPYMGDFTRHRAQYPPLHLIPNFFNKIFELHEAEKMICI